MPLVLVYDEDFSTPGSENGWLCIRSDNPGVNAPLTRVTGDGAPYIKVAPTALNPMWWDPNHYHPGIGYVNLLAFAYAASWGGVLPNLNLSGARIVLQVRAKGLRKPRAVRFLWWFQVQSPAGSGPYLNYGQIGHPIDQQLGYGSVGATRPSMVDGIVNSGWRTVEIPCIPSDLYWQCYGSSPLRDGLSNGGLTTHYACAPGGVAEAMSYGIADMGIHAVWRNTMVPAQPPADIITGELHIRRIQVFELQ